MGLGSGSGLWSGLGIVTLEPPVIPAGFAAAAGAVLPALAAGAAWGQEEPNESLMAI